MNPDSTIRSRLETVFALAHLLQRVEVGRARADADAYRHLVSQLQAALAEEMPADAVQAILAAYPAAGEVYENLHYEQAGLSLAPLERSVASEQAAKAVLARAAAH
ncbi:MAG: hypothetical protein IT503_17220 [Burkholderiaceae bacterium]|nr:hypothetical protein [Ideonella sp.]MCC7287917.1 hypothetical protein [Burkholderiaceae bacterium]